jgi:hypothetical protein
VGHAAHGHVRGTVDQGQAAGTGTFVADTFSRHLFQTPLLKETRQSLPIRLDTLMCAGIHSQTSVRQELHVPGRGMCMRGSGGDT